jgi:hypothetical protein
MYEVEEEKDVSKDCAWEQCKYRKDVLVNLPASPSFVAKVKTVY